MFGFSIVNHPAIVGALIYGNPQQKGYNTDHDRVIRSQISRDKHARNWFIYIYIVSLYIINMANQPDTLQEITGS